MEWLIALVIILALCDGLTPAELVGQLVKGVLFACLVVAGLVLLFLMPEWLALQSFVYWVRY